MDLEEVNAKLHELSVTRKKPTTFSEEYEAWKEWCLMWDKREELEQAARDDAESYSL